MSPTEQSLQLTNENLESLVEERTARLKLIQSITVAANEANDVHEAVQTAINEICRFTGWPVGHAYFYDQEEKKLLPSGIWYLEDTERFSVFKEITERTTFERDVGLPGTVLESKQPEWFMDVQNHPTFPRARQAADIGVHAGFAVPVMMGEEVAAVLEFFATDILEPDRELLNSIAYIGTQLGRVTERKEADS